MLSISPRLLGERVSNHLEKAMAPQSSTLAWTIPWREEPGRLQSMGVRRVKTLTERLHFHFSLSCIGEGNGNPLQCSCLENSRDGGAWWAAIYGVAQSRTRLKLWMWELDDKESWLPKNWCFWTVVLEKTLESPLNCKKLQSVHPKGNQSWTFIGRTDVGAEAPILWPPDAKSWLTWKDHDAGKDCRWEEKGMIEDKMVGWHHQLNGHEFEQALGDGEGQRSLVCCGPWGRRELGTTERLSWTELCLYVYMYKLLCATLMEYSKLWHLDSVLKSRDITLPTRFI